MSRLLPKLAGIAAVAAVVVSVGVGSAAAKVTRYHESDGTVVSISTPNVATTAGGQTQASVTVSVSGPSPLYIGPEGFLTGSGQGDGKWDGLSFVHYGCWTHAGPLYSGQSCTSTISFTPTFVGTHNETYLFYGTSAHLNADHALYANFTASGLPSSVGPTPNPVVLAP